MTRGRERGVPEAAIEKGTRVRQRRTQSMVMAYRAGVKIFMGTDTCNTMPFGSHAWELELMHRYIGMSPMETISAATAKAADALALEALPFLKHLVGLADAGGETEVDLQPAALLLADQRQEMLRRWPGCVGGHGWAPVCSPSPLVREDWGGGG